MVSNGARRRLATSRRMVACLRLLERGRGGGNGLGTLRDDVAPRLRAVVADALGLDADRLADDVALESDLAVDSLDLLDLVGRVEEAFDVVVPEREAVAVRTIGDLIAVTTALLACRLRARDDEPGAPATLAVRIGSGVVPRFLRALGGSPYDREVLRDDVLRARAGDAVTVSGCVPGAGLDRAVLRAGLAGADVRLEDGSGGVARDPLADDEDARAWPAGRLAAASRELMDRLAGERDASVALLEAPGRARAALVAERRGASDAQVDAVRSVLDAWIEIMPDAHAATRELAVLGRVRRAVDARGVTADATREAYDAVLSGFGAMIDDLAAPASRMRRPPRGMTAPSAPEREELRA
jgi:acyl carrier protein